MFKNLRQQLALRAATRFYNERLRLHGATSKGVHWASPERQIRRFEVLTELIDREQGTSISDFGCGYGALFDHISERGFMKEGSYIGYDQSQAMVDLARENISDPRARFVCANEVTETADYTLISGTLNLKMHATEEAWWGYITQCLAECWKMTEKALAFNLLRKGSPTPDRRLFYANREEALDFCKARLSYRSICFEVEDLPDLVFFVTR
jgi:SAM-dependent methyltransferase